MATSTRILFVFLSSLILNAYSSGYLNTKIVELLLNNSDPNVIPIKNAEEPVELQITLSILNIHMDGPSKMKTDFDCWMMMKWANNLPFQPERYDNITAVNVDRHNVWTPDIAVFNGEMRYRDDSRNQIIYSHDGYATFVPFGRISTYCQPPGAGNTTCSITIGSWMHSTNFISLSNDTRVILTGYQSHVSEFEVLEAVAVRNRKRYDCCMDAYDDITYEITFAEKN